MITVVVVISILAQTCSVYGAWKKLDISGYMANQGEVSTFIDDNYVDPRNVELTFPEQKRNLIYIFLESMEDTYGDTENGGGFEENVIPELTSLARKNEDFSGKDTTLNGGYCMPGRPGLWEPCLVRHQGCRSIFQLMVMPWIFRKNFFLRL